MSYSKSSKGAKLKQILEVKRPTKSASSTLERPISKSSQTKSTASLNNNSSTDTSSDHLKLHYEKNKPRTHNRALQSLPRNRKLDSSNVRRETDRNIKHTASNLIEYQHEPKVNSAFKRQSSLPSTKHEKSKKYKEKSNVSIKENKQENEQSYIFYTDIDRDRNIDVSVNIVANIEKSANVNDYLIPIVKIDKPENPHFVSHGSIVNNNDVNLLDLNDDNQNQSRSQSTQGNTCECIYENLLLSDTATREIVQTFNFHNKKLIELRRFLSEIDEMLSCAARLLDNNVYQSNVEDLLEKFQSLSTLCFSNDEEELMTALYDNGNTLEKCEIQISQMDENELDSDDENLKNSDFIIHRNEDSSNSIQVIANSSRSSSNENLNDIRIREKTEINQALNSHILGTFISQTDPEDNYSVNSYSSNSSSGEVAIGERKPSYNYRKLQFIIEELKETEKKYVNDLDKIVNIFRPFIQKKATSHKDKIKHLFCNVDKILFGAQVFLRDLENAFDALQIGEIFILHEDTFQLYLKYLRNKPRCDYNLKYFDKEIKELLEHTDEKLNLASYLMVPFQRLVKYILLLEKIEEELVKVGQETEIIIKAIAIIRNILSRGNTGIAIDSINNAPIKGDHWGSFVMRDEFTCIKPKRNELVLFLFEELVVFTTSHHKQKERFDYVDSINLTDLIIIPREPNSIELCNYGRHKKVFDRKTLYLIEAKNEKIAQKWKDEIEKRLWKQMEITKETALKTITKTTSTNRRQSNESFTLPSNFYSLPQENTHGTTRFYVMPTSAH